MRKLLFSSLFFVFILTGCSNEAYNNAIQKGLDYIESESFEKAEAAFEFALDEKKQDIKATTLLEQTRNYREALDALERADLELAREKAEEVSKETEGSNTLVKKADEIFLSIEGLQTKQTELTEKYESAMQQFEEKKYDDVNKTIDELLSADLSHSLFHALKNNAEKLQNDIEIALIEKEKVENEEVEKDKVERAVTENAKKQKNRKVNLTPEDALKIIEDHRDWPLSTTFELDPTVYFLDGKHYYGIYVDTPIDESFSSGGIDLYLIDPNDGSVYNYDQGDLQREYIKVN